MYLLGSLCLQRILLWCLTMNGMNINIYPFLLTKMIFRKFINIQLSIIPKQGTFYFIFFNIENLKKKSIKFQIQSNLHQKNPKKSKFPQKYVSLLYFLHYIIFELSISSCLAYLNLFISWPPPIAKGHPLINMSNFGYIYSNVFLKKRIKLCYGLTLFSKCQFNLPPTCK